MTRINVVPVTELSDKHLAGEYHEITRVFGLVRKAQVAGREPAVPPTYRMGAGHVTFFYDKLYWVLVRYWYLTQELKARGKNPSPISESELTEGIDKKWLGGYMVTPEALAINRQRIKERS